MIGSKYTTYSFDEGNSHFIVLDLYSGETIFQNRSYGSIKNELYNWLKDDLESTTKENIFVFGHQPAIYAKDEDDFINSRARYDAPNDESLKTRTEFWDLLKTHH